jgi:hypothetical protein
MKLNENKIVTRNGSSKDAEMSMKLKAGVAIAILAQCVSEMRSKERPKCNYDRFM